MAISVECNNRLTSSESLYSILIVLIVLALQTNLVEKLPIFPVFLLKFTGYLLFVKNKAQITYISNNLREIQPSKTRHLHPTYDMGHDPYI